MTEMGQGTNTILAQIAAEALGIPYEQVEVLRPDTALVPNSGPTVASRTAMVIGKLVESAALSLKTKLMESSFLPQQFTLHQFQSGVPELHCATRRTQDHGAISGTSRHFVE